MRLSVGERMEISTLPAWSVRSSSKDRIESVTTSLIGIRRAISDEDWTKYGFKELQLLGTGLQNIDRLVSVEEVYSKLAHLRMWMFCVELEGDDDTKYQLMGRVMRIYFYVLLMAMTPYMPSRCCGQLHGTCRFMIRRIQGDGFENINPEVRQVFGLFCEENHFA